MKDNMRIEHDSMGEVAVPADKYWGAQTQRSLTNFPIGGRMPPEIIHSFGYLKKAAALTNRALCPDRMTEARCATITAACDEVIAGTLDDHFPLVVYQTGSGTQTNMNANEVIAGRANVLAAGGASAADIPAAPRLCHPNDHVNMSQSSNDTFPAAMHIAAKLAVRDRLLPALDELDAAFSRMEADYGAIIKCGRTHLQDATPIRFGQEIAGWRGMLSTARRQILAANGGLSHLALGGTAVGTGLNAPAGFDVLVAEKLSELTGEVFVTDPNKFHALSAKDELVFSHGALKALAADLMKIANDIRLLGSGPRLGLGELTLPANEPGSSIMPGKVNPTQCEALTMVAVRVMANDTAVGLAASQGQFQLNVFMPVLIDAYLESVRLLSDAMASFARRCVAGIRPVRERMEENLRRSLMTVTALTPHMGYENAARVAHLAHEANITLREATLRLGYLSAEEFDRLYHPEEMT